MNTLSDTDEGRPRPSVWPVYVMSAVVGLQSLALVVVAVCAVWEVQQPEESYWTGAQILGVSGKTMVTVIASLFGLFGLFCIVAAVSASKLRPWAWWVIAVQFAVGLLLTAWDMWTGYTEYSLLGIVGGGCIAFAVLWPLVTRRRLFFPPKPAGEEKPQNAQEADR